MERVAVESKALRSIGYDAEQQVLEIEFRGGKVYQYLEVPPSLHEWLMRSQDKGSLFRHKIDGCFEFRRVDHLDPDAPSLEDALRASLAAMQGAKPSEPDGDGGGEP